MRPLILAFALALLAQPALADDAAMTKLAAEFDAWLLSEDPITAGRQGDRTALSKLPDVRPAADARRLAPHRLRHRPDARRVRR